MEKKPVPLGLLVLQKILVVLGSVGLTFALFLVLPAMQTIANPPESDLSFRTIDSAHIPPPPPPPEEEPEEEEEQEEEAPPELEEQADPLDLSQLELALNLGSGGAWQGDFAIKIGNATDDAKDVDALFSMADLDQKPRVLYQPAPRYNADVRKRAPGTVYIIFIVDERGRVENPIVQSSTDPVFEQPALSALSKWKFEPGKRNGKPVKFRMRVPITFPKR